MKFIDEISADLPSGSAQASLFVDPQAEYFDDHFPGNPMLPGLVMLEAAVRAAGSVWPPHSRPVAAALDRVERFQVLRRVVPGEMLVVTVEVTDQLAEPATQTFKAVGVVAGETAMRATFRLRLLDALMERSRR